MSRIERRTFMRRSVSGAIAGAGLAGLADAGFLSNLRPVSAEEAALDPRIVKLDPAIEPLVRLLENTPRDNLLEEVGARIRAGLSYREVLAALLLAGVRNVQPRPAVGFKFHAVLVVNAAHLASLSSPDAHRWLPIFWALDYFKSSQARDVQEGNWTMGPVDEARVPKPHDARDAFRKAMESWDEEAADAAIAGFVRSAGAQEVFEEFFRLGARDFRSIGHKAIFVSNSWRTLACIGWQHAEPVLRSLAYALLQHEGENPSKRDGDPDRPGRRNAELLKPICARCRGGGGKRSAEATAELLSALRDGSDEDAPKQVVKLLQSDASPASMWDALFQGASELVLRKPGIISLHAATTTNALHFAYQTAGTPETRAMLLLQGASFIPLFRDAAKQRGGDLAGVTLDSLEREKLEHPNKGDEAVEEILSDLSDDRLRAARKALAYIGDGTSDAARRIIDAARLLIFFKGNDAHDYKYSSAVLEDFYSVVPSARARYLASSLGMLTGSKAKDNGLVKRTRAALG